MRWPVLVQQYSGGQHRIIEAGLSNRTLVHEPPFDGTKNGVLYLKPYLESHHVDVIVIMLGTNDLKRRFALTPEDIANGLDRLITEIRNFYVTVNTAPQILIISPPAVREIGQFADIYAGATKKSHALVKHFQNVAVTNACAFLNAQSFVAPCEREGVHLPPSEHEKLAIKVCSLLEDLKG